MSVNKYPARRDDDTMRSPLPVALLLSTTATILLPLLLSSSSPLVDAADATIDVPSYAIDDGSGTFSPDASVPPAAVADDDDDDDDGEYDEEYGSEDDEEIDYDGTKENYVDVGDYEIRIRQALTHYQTRSHRLLYGSLSEGLGGGRGDVATNRGEGAGADIGIDGNTVINVNTDYVYGDDDVDEELWRVQFGVVALQKEMEILNTPKEPRVEATDDEYDDEYGGGSDDDDDDDDDEEEEEEDDEEEVVEEGKDGADDHDGVTESVYARQRRIFLNNDPELKALLDSTSDQSVREEIYWDVKKEADMVSNMDVDKWYALSYWKLHAYFGCARVFAFSRPLYTNEMWTELRQLWRDFAIEDKETVPPLTENEMERTYRYGSDSFDPPMEPFQSGMKGRGLRATRDISKGEMVFKATNNTVIFTRGHTWRLFLFYIYERHGEAGPLDSGMTCDTLVWSWVQTLEEDGDPVVVADFDNGSLLNEGRDEEGWDPPNVRCGKEGDTMCMMEYYATKDIRTGDEILCDYREFAMLDSWEDIGL